MKTARLAYGMQVTANGQRRFAATLARAASRVLDVAPPVLLTCLALFLSLYNLEFYPRTWFDEGSHLHVSKALVTFGAYADYSSEGLRYNGPVFGVGPTVLLPIALSFEALGVSLSSARLVMVAYLLLTLLLYYRLVSHLFGGGRSVAVLASLLLLGSQGIGFLETGRQVLGEVPAFGFFLAGALLWFSALDRGGRVRLALSGLAFGLAMVTKTHYMVMLPPTLALVWALDRWRFHRLRTVHVLAPLAIAVSLFGVWYAWQLGHLGWSDFLDNVARLRSSSSGAIFVFSPSRMLAAGRFLVSPEVLYGWALPGVAYGFLGSLSLIRPSGASESGRGGEAYKLAFISSFSLVWLCWFVFASIGWPRYAFPALALSAALAAKLLSDLARSFVGTPIGMSSPTGMPRHKAEDARRGTLWLRKASLALAALVVVGFPLLEVAHTIVAAPDRSPQQFAGFLNATVEPDAIVETWEPELGFLTDHRYHYPPITLLDDAVKRTWLEADARSMYDVRSASPTYLAVGRFGKWIGIYADDLAGGGWTVVGSVGEYDLYRLR